MANEVLPASVKPASLNSSHLAAAANVLQSQLATRALASFPQDLLDFRKWDALEQLLPSAGTGSYLGLITGTFGTAPPQLQTGDLHSAGATTRRARTIIPIPDNYPAGGALRVRCNAGMKTTIADTSAVILVEAFLLKPDGTLTTNLVTTGAQSINSLTLALLDFVLDPTVDPTDTVAGARLDLRVSITVTDGATGTAVIGVLQDLLLRCDAQP